MKISHITKKEIIKNKPIQGIEIREGIFNFIQKKYPDFTTNDYISLDELNLHRRLYLESIVIQEKGELEIIDKEIIEALNKNSILSEDILKEIDSNLTFGQRVADKVADFGGSWTFIISFFLFIVIWMIINIWILTKSPFDPYPFILLNLILSCLAAIQAPIIMMSQNRQEQKDRKQSEQDYKTNLKAELEIKFLNEKIDHLINYQNKKLIEFQEIQMDYLEDIMKELKNK